MNQILRSGAEFLESIKFSHSIFALPFALIAMLLAQRGKLPTAAEALWIIIAMIGARTWAMGINRVVDAKIDAQNPRTAMRAIPQGKISAQKMFFYSLLGAVIFIWAAFSLSLTAGLCSIPVLLILASYSYTKRFTFLCHFWLGFCLGLAPLGAWVALTNHINPNMLFLTFAISCWVGGFDILYALQDEDFDREHLLHSIPARFGTKTSLRIAQVTHVIAALLFIQFGLTFDLGGIYYAGILCATALMVYEHILVTKHGLQKINIAFFNLNGWISVVLLVATALNLYTE